MVIALLRYAVITAARVLATASAALVGLANLLGISTEVSSTPAGRKRKADKQQRQIHSQASTEDCHYESRKYDFLRVAGTQYGYGGRIEDLSKIEFSRLRGRVYVDHAGATLYSEKQLRAAHQDLSTQLYSNPHSGHVAWCGDASASEAEMHARALTLAMCNASERDYECIFVSGATGAMKLVAESFPWSRDSRFVYTQDNHNSAVGMRELALNAGASAVAVNFVPDIPEEPLVVRACSAAMSRSITRSGQHSESSKPQSHSLFAYPLESNFSGARYDLQHVGRVQQHGLQVVPVNAGSSPDQIPGDHKERWYILLDAAKACCSAPPDLSQSPADFVALSFYKIFGYPTGLGALLVRKEALQILDRAYFGGGAVSASVADADFFRRRPGAAGLEDGTPAYLAIASLAHGFAQLNKLGSFPAIEQHTATLTRWLADRLALLRHSNDQPVCVLYGAHAQKGAAVPASSCGIQRLAGAVGQGPVVAFNVLRPDGSFVGYREVEKLAGLCSILLRTGCFCNPGACQAHLGLSHQDVISNYEAGHVCWDDNDLINGRPTGAVRVSFGYMSTFADADAVFRFVLDYFVDAPASTVTPLSSAADGQEEPAACAGTAASPESEQVSVDEQRAAQEAESIDTSEAPVNQPGAQQLQTAPDLAAESELHNAALARALTSSFYEQTLLASLMADNPAEVQNSSDAVHSDTAGQLPPQQQQQQEQQQSGVSLGQVFVYPIKSCAGFAPESWPLGQNGLLYDREWALVDGDGAALTQKKLPRLATIRPTIDMDAGILEVHAPGMAKSCVVPLPKEQASAPPAMQPPAAPAAALTETQLEALDKYANATSDTRLHRAGSTSSLGSLDGSFTGSVISQSGVSFTGSSFTSRHSNSAMWPRPSDRSSASGQQRLQTQLSSASSMFEPGADPVGAAALAREAADKQQRGGKKVVDLRAVRSRFRHLRNRPSTQTVVEESASSQSEPAPAVTQLGGSAEQHVSRLAATGSSATGVPHPERPVSAGDSAMRHVQICADSVCSLQVGTSPAQSDAVSDWFSEALGVRCWLVRQQDGSRRAVERSQLLQRGPHALAPQVEAAAQEMKRADGGGSIGFANEGQFLAISLSSLGDVNRRLAEKQGSNATCSTPPFQVEAERFRPNLLFSGGMEPYAEDTWRTLHIGECHFNVTGPCARCQVVCTDPEAGQRGGPEPLLTLAAYRRTRGQIHFGILLENASQAQPASQWLRVGHPVLVSP